MCLAIAFGVVAASRFPKPSLMQEFRTQLADRRMLIDFDVAEKTKTLTYGAGCAEFADGESHRLSVSGRAGDPNRGRNYILARNTQIDVREKSTCFLQNIENRLLGMAP
jgi:hypothetical protein